MNINKTTKQYLLTNLLAQLG